MKISLEVDVLAHEDKTGVYYYLQRLLQATLELDTDNDYSLVYFGQPGDAQGFGLPLEGVTVNAITRFPQKLYRLLLRTPFAPPIDWLAKVHPEIIVFPAFVRWPLRQTKSSLVIIYDTAYIDHPEVIATRRFQRYLSRVVPRSIRQVDKIITISESTKQALISHYRTPANKITVITPALDHSVYQPAKQNEVSSVKAKYRIERPYLLYVGTLEPRKNIVGIINAYQALPDELQRRYQLVLGGKRGWQDGDIQAAIAGVPAKDLVITGYIAEEDMAALYNGASVFVYPSFYEGWGMQVLEAMACGTPVITADNSSLPEAGGDAGLYVKAGDDTGLTDAIKQVLGDPKLAAEMVRKGKVHAARFTWDKSAQRLKQTLEAPQHEN